MSIYACSDLHGNWDIYKHILSILKPEDTLYFLGDAADRGKDGFAIILDMLSKKDQIKYIKGNHEDMLVKALKAEIAIREEQDELNRDMYEDICLLFANGGECTFSSIMETKSIDYIKDFIKILDNLPTQLEYTNENGVKIVMTHSGDLTKPLWDRTHYLKHEEIPDNEIHLHGHTPIPHMFQCGKNSEAPFFYNENQKINIDCGTHFTNTTILLNLNTFEVIKITAKGNS